MSDVTAIGVHERRTGRRTAAFPRTCRSSGFDDIPAAAWVWPRLTTVHQPIREKGRLAATRLIDAIASGEAALRGRPSSCRPASSCAARPRRPGRSSGLPEPRAPEEVSRTPRTRPRDRNATHQRGILGNDPDTPEQAPAGGDGPGAHPGRLPERNIVTAPSRRESTGIVGRVDGPARPPSRPATSSIELWTKEGDPKIEFVQQLADDYTALHSNVTFNVVNKDVEVLREDMVNTALAPDAQPSCSGRCSTTSVRSPRPASSSRWTGMFDESVMARWPGSGTTMPDSGASQSGRADHQRQPADAVLQQVDHR